jgi:hypothetical protein
LPPADAQTSEEPAVDITDFELWIPNIAAIAMATSFP